MWSNAAAQSNLTSSPYTFFGFGDVYSNGFTASHAMGDFKYALHSEYNVNPANPATYSLLKAPTFDLGASLARVQTESKGISQLNDNAGISHASLAFPLSKRVGLSFGIMPFSEIGYDIRRQSKVDTSFTRNEVYLGRGVLNKFYLGLGAAILKDTLQSLSVGANVTYSIGEVEKEARNEFSSPGINSSREYSYFISDFNVELGAFYKRDFSINRKDKQALKGAWSLGVFYRPKKKMKTDYEFLFTNFLYRSGNLKTVLDTTSFETKSTSIEMPFQYGAGGSLEIQNFGEEGKSRLLLGLDFEYTNWEALKIEEQEQAIRNSNQFAFGMQYVPNDKSLRKLHKIMRYRLGVRYKDTQYVVGNQGVNEYGITFGLGIPIVSSKSTFATSTSINLGVELGQRGKNNGVLIQERWVGIQLGLTLTPSAWDKWFERRKIE